MANVERVPWLRLSQVSQKRFVDACPKDMAPPAVDDTVSFDIDGRGYMYYGTKTKPSLTVSLGKNNRLGA